MQKQWFLEAIAADGSRLTYVVSGSPFRVGRDPDNELVVNTISLSRRHAELSVDVSGRLRLIDLDSTNGTLVNGSLGLDTLNLVGTAADYRVDQLAADTWRITDTGGRQMTAYSIEDINFTPALGSLALDLSFVNDVRSFPCFTGLNPPPVP